MKKNLRLAKSVLQTCFFAMKNQRNISALLGSIALISFFEFLTYDPRVFMYSPGVNCNSSFSSLNSTQSLTTRIDMIPSRIRLSKTLLRSFIIFSTYAVAS